MAPIQYEEVRNKPEVFLAMTGLVSEEFDILLTFFTRAWATRHPGEQQGRGRPAGIRTHAEKLLFILFYYKCYPLQELLGHLFGISQERACECIADYGEVLRDALKLSGNAPERDPQELKKILRSMFKKTTP